MTRFEALAAIRARKPLLHCISNLVTANDCANLALAVGASPIMAQAPQEMADIAVLASAVVLNTGTPDEAKFTAARLAGAAANRRGIPVVLDPVGVGASPWRLENIRQLLQEVHPAILRANYGEAAALLGLSAAEHGVDSLTVPIDAAACAQALAQKLGTVVVLSGAEDLVTDGTALHTVSGGSDLMRRVTGAFHLVGSASNGLDALELVEQLEPDLLLTDIRMPFITGIELARQVREIRPAMHIAFLSGYDDFEYAKQAIQYNIISYMLKPLTMDGLAAELKSIHERIDHQYASLRRSGIVQEDRASFLIPLVLEHCDNTSDAVEAALRTSAAACGLLRGTDDRSQLVVLTAQPDDNSENAAGFVRMVDQLANKYLRHYAFFCNDHVVAVLFGNPSDFDEYLHILADEICQLTERALGQHCVVGVSRAAARFCELNAGYRQSMEALTAAKETEGGVSFTPDVRKGGSLCERALEIIEQHYSDEDLSLASLSAMLDVSPNHLSACIKKTAGETFINILVRRRMETAQQLLLTTDLQIQEIARRCGYSDQHYFSYCFKKYSGTSPGALRRSHTAGAQS